MDQSSTFSSMFEDVALFHRHILDVPFPRKPTFVSNEFILEKYKFLNEELNEFYDAAANKDFVVAVDGLLDLIYVALGTLYSMGVPADVVWKFVQEANMKKTKGVTSRGNKVDAVKPADWHLHKPEVKIAEFLKTLGYESD